MTKDSVIYGLSASSKLAKKISVKLKIELGKVDVLSFADGEILTQNRTSVRGKEVFVVQSTSSPVNDNLMELLIFLDSLKRASAKEITVIMPYYGYARQDRKTRGRQPISAKLVANMLEGAGAHRIITFDIHSPQIQGFFDIPVDNIKTSFLFYNELVKRKYKDLVIVSPDHGGITRARELSIFLQKPLVIIDKIRHNPNESKVMNALGEYKGKECLILDDIIDTGGTIINAAKFLYDGGAKRIMVAATHAVFSGESKILLQKEFINEVIVTDTIEHSVEEIFKNLTIISISDLASEIIETQNNNKSVSDIYGKYYSSIKK